MDKEQTQKIVFDEIFIQKDSKTFREILHSLFVTTRQDYNDNAIRK